ncbi:MAG: hypothetical protein ACRDHX_02780 [Chloroflexota bacterium]
MGDLVYEFYGPVAGHTAPGAESPLKQRFWRVFAMPVKGAVLLAAAQDVDGLWWDTMTEVQIDWPAWWPQQQQSLELLDSQDEWLAKRQPT